MKLAAVCTRAGVDSTTAGRIFLRNATTTSLPWAKEVFDEGRRWLVGQGLDPRFFVCFPLPFSGHSEDWQLMKPINSAEDFLEQIQKV